LLKDMCSCYANYQGNDCSERTCYFGLAHVDTPKGDLNSDGVVSGPLTTVITGSETYPWGTQEQYPNADENEGHFYMECSNKGICDRKSGECECFDGYEGTACVRASCPNDCSGHGTCESIRELAELKTYDSNAAHTATTLPAAEHGTEGIEESYDYGLWDADKTMGCRCDPGFYGADCSQKKCKYGVDPLFSDTDGVISQATVVHLGSKGANAANIGGTFSIAFFDVFGEKYTSKPLTAVRTAITSEKIVAAFEALPNGVIQQANHDVTQMASPAVDVSVSVIGGDITRESTAGAGAVGESGAGLGTYGNYGPEFTVTFKHNPGILKTIELDTRQITNAGTEDYWVANMRQGQFDSRYTHRVGHVNTLLYGSKVLFVDSDPSSLGIATDNLIKINGQEFAVESTHADSNIILLNEAFLGTTISPTITDTGAVATSVDRTARNIVLKTGYGVTAANQGAFVAHAKLYMAGHPFTNDGSDASIGENFDYADPSPGEFLVYFETDQEHIIYRRSENVDNQNFYKASSDVATPSTETYCATRGTNAIYTCAADSGGATSKSFTDTTLALVLGDTNGDAVAPSDAAAGSGVFIGVQGPYKVDSISTNDIILEDTNPGQTRFSDYIAGADKTYQIPTFVSAAATQTGINDVKVALLNGRRYKIASVVTTADGVNVENEVTGTKITLTESFSGPHIQLICASCVHSVGAASGGAQDIVIKDGFVKDTIAQGDALLLGGSLSYDNLLFATASLDLSSGADDSGANARTLSVSESGTNAVFASIADTVTGVSLYRLTIQNGFTPVWITESTSQATYNYVSQCSNRGICDGATGLCACFKGYSGDNCNQQNMMAV